MKQTTLGQEEFLLSMSGMIGRLTDLICKYELLIQQQSEISSTLQRIETKIDTHITEEYVE